MKKTFLVFFYTLLSVGVYSQRIIENPGFGFSTSYNLTIKTIEIRDTATIISFHAAYPIGYNITIPKQTYIQPENGSKLYIRAAEGIPLNKQVNIPASGETDYKLIFPKIDSSVSKLDYGEEGAGASWFFYDIVLGDSPSQSIIPGTLRSSWFNKNTGDWEFSFFDSTAVYKNRVWNYGKIKLTNGEGTLELKDNQKRVLLTVKPATDGSYLIGENTNSLKAYVQNSDIRRIEKGFQSPVFKNDSVVLSGYFCGYSQKISKKTISFHLDDILAGNDYSFTARLDDKGFFSVKIPLYYPHQLSVNAVVRTGKQIFLEPGKDLFVLFDSPHNKQLYAGESANINRDLDNLEKVTLNFSPVLNKLPNLTSSQFKSECIGLMQEKLDSLKALREKHSIGEEAFQFKRRDIEFKSATFMLKYNEYRYQALLAQNKTGKPIAFNPENLAADYYDFITSEMINDPLNVLSANYSDFLTRLEQTKFIRGEALTYSEMIRALEASGYSLTPEEKQLKEDLKIAEDQEDKKIFNSISQNYGSKAFELYLKYYKQFNELQPGIRKGTVTLSMAYDSLAKKGVNFTQDEKAIIEQQRILDHLPSVIMANKIRRVQEKFYTDHEDFLSALNRQHAKKTTEENLAKLGVQKGMTKDILNARMELGQIMNQYILLADPELKSIRKEYNTPFIADYVIMQNKSQTDKIAANKKKGGSLVYEVPKVPKEKLFEELMKKYSGKVVLVDFWATWCGPCRAGIERIKPLKEELSKEKVVFVYITDPSSPKQTYNHMIPDIKGEHYRVSNEEWRYLSDKFNITGIPHQVLVDKTGKVINPHFGYPDNEYLKEELEKRINE